MSLEEDFFNWEVAHGERPKYINNLITYLNNNGRTIGRNVNSFLTDYDSAFDCEDPDEIDAAYELAKRPENRSLNKEYWASAALARYRDFLIAKSHEHPVVEDSLTGGEDGAESGDYVLIDESGTASSAD